LFVTLGEHTFTAPEVPPMRITRKAKLAAGLVATLAIFTATLPSNAAPTDPVAVAVQPVAGSSNVEVEGNRIILGDAAAAIGSTEIKQRSGLAAHPGPLPHRDLGRRRRLHHRYAGRFVGGGRRTGLGRRQVVRMDRSQGRYADRTGWRERPGPTADHRQRSADRRQPVGR
jgi:hypothetical protein